MANVSSISAGLLPVSTTATSVAAGNMLQSTAALRGNTRSCSRPLRGQALRRLRLGRHGPRQLELSAAAGEGGEGDRPWQHGHGCWSVRVRAAVPGKERGRQIHGTCGSSTLDVSTERGANDAVPLLQGPVGRIREALEKVELSMSSYDTAWVAMVPSSNSAMSPQFPQCIDWILENQHPDGSWGPYCHPHLMKDTLSSTLACVLALKRWNLGEDHIDKGINFILSNLPYINVEKQHAPIGFNIIFPRMIGLARDMRLHLPISQIDIDMMLHMREQELKRASEGSSKGAKAYLAYVAEGLDRFPEWEDLRKYQRKNGSLFDSPSTTAAALINDRDSKCLEYLSSLLQKFGNAVPARYPMDMHACLHMVDSLEGLGLDQHFRNEIKDILDEVYRRCQHNDEEIYSNIAIFAMAFRLLRMHGYEISSDFCSQLEEDFFRDSLEGHLEDTMTVLELHKASQLGFPSESFFDKLYFWTSNFLSKKISNIGTEERLGEAQLSQVDYALKFPLVRNMKRLEHRRNITHLSIDNFRILKTSYRLWNIDSKDIQDLAAEEFNNCQVIYQKELEQLHRWTRESRLDQLSFAREKTAYCYFSVVALVFHPEMCDVRTSWTKTSALATILDDFFDVGGSKEEHQNLIHIMERWDENWEQNCCSENVKILYSALRATVNELGAKAFMIQKRDVTSHIIETWLDLARSMMKEAEWQQKKIIPTMEEYLNTASVSIALGAIVLPTLYFVGPELSLDITNHPEYHKLNQLMCVGARLLNDIRGFEVRFTS